MSIEKSKQLIRRHFEELYNRGNLAFADDCWAATGVLHDPAMPDLPTGPEGAKQHVRMAREAAPDLHFEIEDLIGDDDLLAVRYRFSGTQRGPILGIPPTNKFATMTGVTFYRMHEDRIVEAWVHWDVLGMLRAMGVPLPGAATEAHA